MSGAWLPAKSRVVLVLGALGVMAALAQRTAPARPVPASVAGNYVDPALCATCHQGIAENFAKTGMGRSAYVLLPQNAVETFGKPFYHAASDSYLEMIERGGRYYQ